ncbi:MAG TPA: hypothetical protein VH913_06540 [Hyphomicrobiaceae bacterium]|jgi:hypothetical protein
MSRRGPPAARHEAKERLVWLAQVADEETLRRKVKAAQSMRRLALEVLEGKLPAGSLMMQHGAAHAHRACMAVAVKILNVARLRRTFRHGDLAKAEALVRLVLARADTTRWDVERTVHRIMDELSLAKR